MSERIPITERLHALRAVAIGANAGIVWETFLADKEVFRVVTEEISHHPSVTVAECKWGSSPKENARHIATFDPPTCIELLDLIISLQRRIEDPDTELCDKKAPEYEVVTLDDRLESAIGHLSSHLGVINVDLAALIDAAIAELVRQRERGDALVLTVEILSKAVESARSEFVKSASEGAAIRKLMDKVGELESELDSAKDPIPMDNAEREIRRAREQRDSISDQYARLLAELNPGREDPILVVKKLKEASSGPGEKQLEHMKDKARIQASSLQRFKRDVTAELGLGEDASVPVILSAIGRLDGDGGAAAKLYSELCERIKRSHKENGGREDEGFFSFVDRICGELTLTNETLGRVRRERDTARARRDELRSQLINSKAERGAEAEALRVAFEQMSERSDLDNISVCDEIVAVLERVDAEESLAYMERLKSMGAQRDSAMSALEELEATVSLIGDMIQRYQEHGIPSPAKLVSQLAEVMENPEEGPPLDHDAMKPEKMLAADLNEEIAVADFLRRKVDAFGRWFKANCVMTKTDENGTLELDGIAPGAEPAEEFERLLSDNEYFGEEPRSGYWKCNNCGDIQDKEEEVKCWACGKGEMIYHEGVPGHTENPDVLYDKWIKDIMSQTAEPTPHDVFAYALGANGWVAVEEEDGKWFWVLDETGFPGFKGRVQASDADVLDALDRDDYEHMVKLLGGGWSEEARQSITKNIIDPASDVWEQFEKWADPTRAGVRPQLIGEPKEWECVYCSTINQGRFSCRVCGSGMGFEAAVATKANRCGDCALFDGGGPDDRYEECVEGHAEDITADSPACDEFEEREVEE